MNPQRPFRSCRDANSTVSKRNDKSARDSQRLATATFASVASVVSSPSSHMKMHLQDTIFDANKQNYAWQWWNNHLAKGETHGFGSYLKKSIAQMRASFPINTGP
jgi:hypothetical protein